jgi:putative ABC transport system ATP-binding protein
MHLTAYGISVPSTPGRGNANIRKRGITNILNNVILLERFVSLAFLSIAGALLQATQGDILIDGTNLKNLSDKEVSKLRLHNLGFILQTSNLIPYLNVTDQLLMVKKMTGKVTKEDRAFATDLLIEVGLGSKLKKYPSELSGGERQRTAIARAFINNPNIILADEPTASLDSNRAFEIVQLISNGVKKHNKAAVMVTHDERMLEFCDRVYQMNDGQLEEIL